MPNCAALSAPTSAIIDSMYTWARRTSSMSITVRRLRYTVSLAVMIRVLVEASAWMKPAVPPLGSDVGVVDGALLTPPCIAPVDVGDGVLSAGVAAGGVLSDDSTERKVRARFPA